MFGLINFANMLPLKLFIKKSALKSYDKSAILHHSGVPAKLNHAITYRQINKTISSSIKSAKACYFNAPFGICADSAVLSVLVKSSRTPKLDNESATSNVLSTILKLQGQVLIGDKALRIYKDLGLMNELLKNSSLCTKDTKRSTLLRLEYLNTINTTHRVKVFNQENVDLFNKTKILDMCSVWSMQTGLPFVFARYSEIRPTNKKYFKIFVRQTNTINKRIKMPYYLQIKESKSRKIDPKDLKEYLKYIYYNIGPKEEKALKYYLFKNMQKKLEV